MEEKTNLQIGEFNSITFFINIGQLYMYDVPRLFYCALGEGISFICRVSSVARKQNIHIFILNIIIINTEYS